MAYTVSFGTINKRENSTSQSYTEALSASCLLKESTDILRPTVSVAAQDAGDALLPCNYMYISAFGRYYWITGIQYVHGSWYVSGEVDALASWKTAIGSTTTYVLRAASQYDEYVPDNQVAFKTAPDLAGNYHDIGLDADGTVIISCAGTGDAVDSEVYYALTTTGWQRIYSKCFESQFLQDYYDAWDAVVQDVRNEMLKPEDFISSAIWVPVKYSDIVGRRARNIHLGFSATGINAKAIDPSTLLAGSGALPINIQLPTHPQYVTYGKWLNGQAARQITIYLPGYGQAVLDADTLIDSNTVSLRWGVDCSGVIHYHIISGGEIHSYFSGNISTPVGWSVSRADAMSAVTSCASAAGSLLTGNLSGFLSGCQSALNNALPSVERISTGGSRALVTVSPNVQISQKCYLLPAGLDFTMMGRPLAKTVQISTLSGYVKCDGTASVSCAGTQEEIQKINSYLTGGFYYE